MILTREQGNVIPIPILYSPYILCSHIPYQEPVSLGFRVSGRKAGCLLRLCRLMVWDWWGGVMQTPDKEAPSLLLRMIIVIPITLNPKP